MDVIRIALEMTVYLSLFLSIIPIIYMLYEIITTLD